MFKKLLCMTALSFAFALSQEVSAAGKCIVSKCGSYNSSALICNDISKCAVNSLNSSEKYSIANYNPKIESSSNIINWIASSGSVYVSCRLMCSNLYYLCYPDNFVRNKIMKYSFEKILSSDFVSAGVTIMSLFSNIKYLAGFANFPIAIISVSQFLPDVLYLLNRGLGKYGVNYRVKCCCCGSYGRWIGFGGFNDAQELDEDFAYLHALYSKKRFWNFLDSLQGVNEADKIPERRRMFESLINRGQIGRIRNEHFPPEDIINAGVPARLIAVNGGWTVSELIGRGINVLKLYIDGISIKRLRNAGVTRNYIQNINANNANDNMAKQELLRKWGHSERSYSI